MFYTVYKITNTINGKIYIGAHRSKSKYDAYMGSGTHLKLAQQKYGIENFSKEILHILESRDEMYEMERQLVDEDFVKDPNTYNKVIGGSGGTLNYGAYLNSPQHIAQIKSIVKEGKKLATERITWLWENDKEWSDNMREQNSIRVKEYYKTNPPTFGGKKHTKESKDKIGKANSKHQKGEGNSQYGTFWVTDDITNIRLRKGETIPDGYHRGRFVVSNKEHECKYCKKIFKPMSTELCCSELCTIKNKGGMIIEQYDEIYISYIKYGSVNKAFIKNNIRYSGSRCKRFHEIRKLYGDLKCNKLNSNDKETKTVCNSIR